MTGRTLFRVKTDLQGQDTWPEAFARAGYTTFITGKWHNGEASVRRVFPNGKAVFLDGMGWPYAMPLKDIQEGQFVHPRPSGEHSGKVFADAACEFILARARQKPNQPWLCYVAFTLPHDPRVAPDEFRRLYDDAKLPLPGNFLPQHPYDIGFLVGRDELLDCWPRTPAAVRRHLGDYYACITYMDAQIGRILAALDETGQRQRTLIVFGGDNGLALGSHGLLGKQSVYEHSMGVPLIVAGPGVPQVARREAFVYWSDVFPTLGALAGVSAPAGSEGRSLAGVLTGSQRSVRDEVFLAFAEHQRSLRDARWKIIRFPQIHRTCLFDLQADPLETRDLAGVLQHKETVAAMLARLEQAQQTYGDKQPLTAAVRKPEIFIPPQGEKMEELIRKNRTDDRREGRRPVEVDGR
jgi:arylsulfatase A-like enzyme